MSEPVAIRRFGNQGIRQRFKVQRPMDLYEPIRMDSRFIKESGDRVLPNTEVIIISEPVPRWLRDRPKLVVQVKTSRDDEVAYILTEKAIREHEPSAFAWAEAYDLAVHAPKSLRPGVIRTLWNQEAALRHVLITEWRKLVQADLQIASERPDDMLERLLRLGGVGL